MEAGAIRILSYPDATIKIKDNVVVSIKRDYYLWHIGGNSTDTDTQTLAIDHDFDIPIRRAKKLTFTFTKNGYGNTVVTVDGDAIDGCWPNNVPFHVVMNDRSVTFAGFDGGTRGLDCTNPGDERSRLNLAHLGIFVVPDEPPPRMLYVTSTPQKFTPGQKIDPLDINLPATLTFHLDESDDGLLLYAPPPSSNPIGQMTLAPRDGYSHEITLSADRLRKLRNPESKMISDRFIYFYFRANGHYGKAQLSWNNYSDGNGHQNEKIEFQILAYARRDDSRDLTSR